MRPRVRLTLEAFVAAGVLSAAAPSAFAQSPARTPQPVAGEHSCNGRLVATFNHESGADGPSGNPTASSGPGFAFGGPRDKEPGTAHDAIVFVREQNCTA
jgi:hypothetical protein